MDADRLKALFEAYGGDPRRWPDRERAAGIALSAMAEPETIEAELELDAWLDDWAIEPATLDLRQRILDQAAGSRALADGVAAGTAMASRRLSRRRLCGRNIDRRQLGPD